MTATLTRTGRRTREEYEIAQAYNYLAGAGTARALVWDFDDFWQGTTGYTPTGAGSATVVSQGGVLTVVSAAAGAHKMDRGAGIDAMPSGSSAEWYWSCRMRWVGSSGGVTVPDATSYGMVHTGGMTMGVNGGVDTTKFFISGNATTVLSSIALDASWHIHAAYRLNGTTYYYIDESLQGSSANVYPTTTSPWGLWANPTSGAVTNSVKCDWWCVAWPESSRYSG